MHLILQITSWEDSPVDESPKSRSKSPRNSKAALSDQNRVRRMSSRLNNDPHSTALKGSPSNKVLNEIPYVLITKSNQLTNSTHSEEGVNGRKGTAPQRISPRTKNIKEIKEEQEKESPMIRKSPFKIKAAKKFGVSPNVKKQSTYKQHMLQHEAVVNLIRSQLPEKAKASEYCCGTLQSQTKDMSVGNKHLSKEESKTGKRSAVIGKRKSNLEKVESVKPIRVVRESKNDRSFKRRLSADERKFGENTSSIIKRQENKDEKKETHIERGKPQNIKADLSQIKRRESPRGTFMEKVDKQDCTTCGKSFSVLYEYKNHLLVHEKPELLVVDLVRFNLPETTKASRFVLLHKEKNFKLSLMNKSIDELLNKYIEEESVDKSDKTKDNKEDTSVVKTSDISNLEVSGNEIEKDGEPKETREQPEKEGCDTDVNKIETSNMMIEGLHINGDPTEPNKVVASKYVKEMEEEDKKSAQDDEIKFPSAATVEEQTAEVVDWKENVCKVENMGSPCSSVDTIILQLETDNETNPEIMSQEIPETPPEKEDANSNQIETNRKEETETAGDGDNHDRNNKLLNEATDEEEKKICNENVDIVEKSSDNSVDMAPKQSDEKDELSDCPKTEDVDLNDALEKSEQQPEEFGQCVHDKVCAKEGNTVDELLEEWQQFELECMGETLQQEAGSEEVTTKQNPVAENETKDPEIVVKNEEGPIDDGTSNGHNTDNTTVPGKERLQQEVVNDVSENSITEDKVSSTSKDVFATTESVRDGMDTSVTQKRKIYEEMSEVLQLKKKVRFTGDENNEQNLTDIYHVSLAITDA